MSTGRKPYSIPEIRCGFPGREAREAVEAGNLETFINLVAEYLRAPAPGSPGPRMAEELLDRVDWDWVAGAYLADPQGSDRGRED
jgi:hypothetical protein